MRAPSRCSAAVLLWLLAASLSDSSRSRACGRSVFSIGAWKYLFWVNLIINVVNLGPTLAVTIILAATGN